MNGRVESYPAAASHCFVSLKRSKQKVHGLPVYVDATGRRVVFD